MRRSFLNLTAFLLILSMVFIPGRAFAKDNPENVKRLVDGNNAFTLSIYKQLSKEDGNIFCSPYSITTALAMAYEGARGETADEMYKVLCFPVKGRNLSMAAQSLSRQIREVNEKGKNELYIANRLWGQKGAKFLKPYLDVLIELYSAPLDQLDFAKKTEESRQTINKWIEKQTKGKITDLLQKGAVTESTILVLTNAIYFKGVWQMTFDPKNTIEANFMVSPEKTVKVPFMNQTEKFNYAKAEDSAVLELPYANEELSMLIMLPDENTDVKSFEKSLTVAKIKDYKSKLLNQKVAVSIPKFKMTSTFELIPALKAMGMNRAFNTDADFTGMTGSKGIYISKVIHKAFVDVNEEGTEAAAATAVVVTRSAGKKVTTFRANRPFVFLIKDNKTDSILFIGRVLNPAKK